MRSEKGTIVFDFDGVIHSYISGWKGMDKAIDPPVKYIKETIDTLIEKGYEIVVVSTRCATEEGLKCVKKYLKDHDIFVHKVLDKKPPALVYIDDRAIRFDGNAKSLVHSIETFIPWTFNENLTKQFVEEEEEVSFGNDVKNVSDNTKEMLYKFVSVLNKEELCYYLESLLKDKATDNIEKDLKYSTFYDDKVDENINNRIKSKYGSL